MRQATRHPAIDGAPQGDTTRAADFERLCAQYEPEVRAFIYSLVPHWPDVDDLLQRTRIVVWSKFAEFQLGSNFRSWILQVSRHEVSNFRRSQSRDRLFFGDGLIDSIADVRESLAGDLEQSRSALRQCLRKLPPSDRQIVRQCYGSSATTTKAAADRLGRPVNTLYKALNRIRHTLMECVKLSAVEQRKSR